MNDSENEKLNIRVDWLKEELSKRELLLFNAFSLTNPTLLQKDPPYEWEDLAAIAGAFLKYKDELAAMGKHPLDIG